MLVHTLPRELLGRVMPLQDLPKHKCAREDVDFVVVFRMRMPQLGCLPVDSTHQAAYHRPCRLLDFGETKVRDLGNTLTRDQDVRRLAVPMND